MCILIAHLNVFVTDSAQMNLSLSRSSTLKELACTIGSTILTIFSEALVSTNSKINDICTQ